MTRQDSGPGVVIRDVQASDVPAVILLDEQNTGLAKPEYWRDLHARYQARREDQFFLVAEHEGAVAGFIIGEIRAWEFGAPPCGWVFAVSVAPGARLSGLGGAMLRSINQRFAAAGVLKVRTLPARDNQLLLSFFRSQGMMAGPSIELEMDIDQAGELA